MIETTRAIARKYGPRIGAAALALPFTVLSFAQDASPGAAGKTQVDATKADGLLVAGAVLAMVVAIWGVYKIIGLFGRR
ncbi:unnamed protein product [marine sediment metagenome]|uniref:Uncharacterized protein n=1 Tax=marine sediment metagenome TaxID=412755 RepID=X1KEF0_9ZZZZ